MTPQRPATLQEIIDARHRIDGLALRTPLVKLNLSPMDPGYDPNREIYLKLDEGELRLEAGDVVIQRATRHGWYNRGSEPCPVAFVLIDSPNYR